MMKPIVKFDQKGKEIIALLLAAFIGNYAIYFGARLIAQTWPHTDITSNLDRMIPFLPWTVILYLGWYVFWGVNYGLCATDDDDERARFFAADALAKAVCFVIFLVFPTTNVRPEVVNTDVFGKLMRLVYYLDNPDNLFPSVHCLVSWLCWIGIRKRKDIPMGYRIFSLLMAIAICISTLTTKQHVIIDVIAGIGLAEISYWICGASCIRNFYSKVIALLLRLFRIRPDI